MNRRFSIPLGFLALIAAGAAALASPWARAEGVWGDAGNALFTACSAVCVTGLTVVDIAQEFSLSGQVALLTLVEIGCLGLMTFSTFLLVAIGRRLSLAREFSLMNAYGVAEIQGLKGLILWVVGTMAVAEGAGTLLLYVRFRDWYLSFFYAVMSFCNAGFGLFPGSLARFADDPYVLFVLAGETILGGIGFLVVYNLCSFRFVRKKGGVRGRISLHAAIVLRYSAYLLAATFAAFLLVEWNASLGGFGFWKKLWVAFYQSVTPRTCGFCVIPTESLQPLTRHVYEALMFFGGGPGSAAAGIKVTTLAVLVATLRAMCRGEQETIISRRAIPYDIVRESLVIVVAMLAFIWIAAGALSVTEAGRGTEASALFFEAVSAVTTTGLSVGSTTPGLSPAGRIVVMLAMFAGRLGALTVVLMIGDRESKRHVRFPSEEIVVG